MRRYEYDLTVSFQDTNLVGNVYFSQYFSWQGKCRESFLFDHAPQVVDDFKIGYGMITKNSSCNFVREAFAFDRILIEMYLKELTRIGATMCFDYYRREPEGKVLLAQGSQAVMWVNQEHRISVMPDYLYNAIREFADNGAAA